MEVESALLNITVGEMHGLVLFIAAMSLVSKDQYCIVIEKYRLEITSLQRK